MDSATKSSSGNVKMLADCSLSAGAIIRLGSPMLPQGNKEICSDFTANNFELASSLGLSTEKTEAPNWRSDVSLVASGQT